MFFKRTDFAKRWGFNYSDANLSQLIFVNIQRENNSFIGLCKAWENTFCELILSSTVT